MSLTVIFTLVFFTAANTDSAQQTSSLNRTAAPVVEADTSASLFFEEGDELDYAVAKTPDSVLAKQYDATAVQFRALDSLALAEMRTQKEFLYDRTPPAPSVWDLIRDWLWRQFGRVIRTQGFQQAWDVFVYAFVFCALVFVVLKLTQTDLRGLFYNEKNIDELTFRDEERLDVDALSALIDDAISKKDYRRAVRYLFLRALKDLATKELIAWRLDKTNRDYVRELKRTDLKEPLAELVRLFEFVWYGEFALNDASFDMAKRTFDSFTIQLREK